MTWEIVEFQDLEIIHKQSGDKFRFLKCKYLNISYYLFIVKYYVHRLILWLLVSFLGQAFVKRHGRHLNVFSIGRAIVEKCVHYLFVNKNTRHELSYFPSPLSEKESQDYLYRFALKKNDNNIVTRHLQKTCHDLYTFDTRNLDNKISSSIRLPNARKCYGCNKLVDLMHHDYVFSCVSCGDKFQKLRYFSTPQTGKVALVIGARTKLGHQIVVKLLRAGAIVVGTSRYPDKMKSIFDDYPEETKNQNAQWKDRLVIYDQPLDLDAPRIKENLLPLFAFMESRFGRLDILVNSAAQTIRSREKQKLFVSPTSPSQMEANKYGELKYANQKLANSWIMTLDDLEQPEMEEILRTNAIAPTLIVQTMLPLLKNSREHPTILNVHAREGLIAVKKSIYHIHTNYGKTCLHMLTKCLTEYNYRTHLNKTFRIHGCCPGFISIDEYFEDSRPWIVPPLDEIDGASRILFPLFSNFKSNPRTRRHYDTLTY